MPAPRHTPEQKARALELYHDHGPAEASRQTGIASELIRQWASRAGVTCDMSQRMAPARMVLQHDHARWQAEMVELLGKIARDRAQWLATQPADKDAVKPMTVMAIAVDKAQLLSGKATQRIEGLLPEQAELAENVLHLKRSA